MPCSTLLYYTILYYFYNILYYTIPTYSKSRFKKFGGHSRASGGNLPLRNESN